MNSLNRFPSLLALAVILVAISSCSKGASGGHSDYTLISKEGSSLANLSGPPSRIVAYRDGLRRLAVFEEGEYGIDFWTTEVNGQDAYRVQSTVTTSFAVTAITARYPDQIFVAGIDDQAGEVVIERWTNSPPAGALAGSMFTAAPGIGNPVGLHWPVVSPVGGSFIPPDQRVAALPPSRLTVYRGTGFVEITSMVSDPEGRFLLLQDGFSGSIYQLVPGQLPSLLVDAQEFPSVSSMRLSLPHQLGTSDRVYLMLNTADFSSGVLHDPDNDGIFDPFYSLGHEQLMQDFPIEPYGDYKVVR